MALQSAFSVLPAALTIPARNYLYPALHFALQHFLRTEKVSTAFAPFLPFLLAQPFVPFLCTFYEWIACTHPYSDEALGHKQL